MWAAKLFFRQHASFGHHEVPVSVAMLEVAVSPFPERH
jgi:hypothetical protein